MDFNNIKKILADEAAAQGIADYEIYYSSSASTSAETLKHEISAFSSSNDGGMCFRCLVDGKMGYASTELFDDDEIRSLVVRAASNAANTEKADEAGIFAGSPSYEKKADENIVPVTAAELKKAALALESEVYTADSRVSDGTQVYSVTAEEYFRIINSHGLDLSNRCGASIVMAYAVVRDGDNTEMGDSIEILNDKTDMKKLSSEAVKAAVDKFGAGTVKSGKYNVVISAKQMNQIMAAFSPAFSAKQAQLGLSLFAGHEGENVAADCVTVTDDPMRAENSFKTTFDAEGVAAHKKTVIDRGVLKTLLYNLQTAKKAGVESTGNASKGGYSSPVGISPYSFCIEAGTETLDGLFAKANDGIFVTEVKGLHAGANAVTGDFSIESEGFMIENGKKTRPVKSFTIAGNFFDMLKSIDSLSDKVYMGVPVGFCAFGSPDVLMCDMSVAGE